MTHEEALTVINELGIDGAVTHKGDELKCYVRDIDEGGVSKTYLTELDCMKISLAFLTLSNALRAWQHKGDAKP